MASGIIIAGDVVASLTTSAAIVGLGLTAADKIGSAYGRIVEEIILSECSRTIKLLLSSSLSTNWTSSSLLCTSWI
ncbi:unnamed protein product [Rotaria sordida]|uniref:Uncharacterized protein n=1 Tax=Rotaria sordida TaxID=392033 RepID=A0A819DHE4_9BILA|nr:unnamed protein product [Rotaria sordida]CAF3833627.1 unnamed protein product [Rotaria sordida]